MIHKTLMISTALLLAACSGHMCGQPACTGQDADKTPAYFAFDSSVLSAEDKDNLDQIISRLKDNPTERVRISGYTDNTGPEAYNMTLSKQRAESAAKYLEAQGISANRIKVRGFGATHFADQNSTEAGRAKNRRIEVSFFQ